jgi:hypothetical protein
MNSNITDNHCESNQKLTVTDSGGGIFNRHICILINCTIARNTALCGGGIYNTGDLTVQDCIITHNNANFLCGAGIYNLGVWHIDQNSIIANNSPDNTFPARPSSGLGEPPINNPIGENNPRDPANVDTAQAKTVSMQETGTPLTGIVLAVSLLLGGLCCSKRK